jgi:hypothetical protein
LSIDSRYIRVASKFWQDEKVKALSDDAKLLYLYVLTSPHSNMAGYYVLPKPYVAYDLNWLPERLDKAFSELLKQGLVKYCKQSDVVLIPNFLKYNPIQNQNQAKGAARRVAELPSNTLREDFRTVLERYAEQFVERFTEWFANTDTDTETDTESETDNNVAKKFDDDSIPMKLAMHLKKEILNQDPTTKTPDDLTKWATEADRMIRLDKRDPEEAAYLITWAQNDSFWQANILSMGTFRKQYDKLKRQAMTMNKSRQSPSRGGETAAQRLLREEMEKERGIIIDIGELSS